MIIHDTAISYYGKYDWPSNFFEEPVRIRIYKSKPEFEFPTGEHAFQACKAALFNDLNVLRKLELEPSPWRAKRLGRQVKGFDKLIWSTRSFDAMIHVIKSRINSSDKIRLKALEMKGKTFIESSPTDRLWGTGLCETSPDAFNPVKWPGKNLQGKAWTSVVSELVLR